MHLRLKAITPLLCLGIALMTSESRAADEIIKSSTSDDGAVIFQTVCIQCHGPKGEGNEQIKSPSIASLPNWYFKTQIHNFREGIRGTDPTDVQGILMATIAKALKPSQVEALSKHVEAMPLVVPKPSPDHAKADLENGRMLFQERCMECHRYNASGELAFGSPPLIGKQDWYLSAQLIKFKTGKRGAAKSDVNGAKMVLSSQVIQDEETLRDITAYILTLNDAFVASQQPLSDPFSNQTKSEANEKTTPEAE